MQTVEDVFWSGLEDARTYLNKIDKPIRKDLHKAGRFVRDGEDDIRKEGRNLKRSATKDLHHARHIVKHGVHDVKTSFNHVRKDLHADWNKLDTFTRKQLTNASNAIHSGVNSVETDFGKFSNWIGDGVDSVKNDVILFLIVGGVLIYFFRDPIGTGVSDLFSEAKSTAKTVINNAATVAPYAAPLLLL
jgi:hypothetical protein